MTAKEEEVAAVEAVVVAPRATLAGQSASLPKMEGFNPFYKAAWLTFKGKEKLRQEQQAAVEEASRKRAAGEDEDAGDNGAVGGEDGEDFVVESDLLDDTLKKGVEDYEEEDQEDEDRVEEEEVKEEKEKGDKEDDESDKTEEDEDAEMRKEIIAARVKAGSYAPTFTPAKVGGKESTRSIVIASKKRKMATMNVTLTVTYPDRELVKRMGAEYDKFRQEWWVRSDNLNYEAGRFER